MGKINNIVSNKEEEKKEVRAWLTEKMQWYNSKQGSMLKNRQVARWYAGKCLPGKTSFAFSSLGRSARLNYNRRTFLWLRKSKPSVY